MQNSRIHFNILLSNGYIKANFIKVYKCSQNKNNNTPSLSV